MIGITIAQIVIFFAYIIFVVKKYGVIGSISESWYRLEKDKNASSSWFNVFTMSVGVLQFCYQNFTDYAQMAFIGSGLGLIVVGIASTYKDKMVDRIHYGGAVTSILLGFLGLYLQYGDYYFFLAFVALAVIGKLIKLSNYTWWIEIAAFLLIMVRLLIR